jgi:hypothetical protein
MYTKDGDSYFIVDSPIRYGPLPVPAEGSAETFNPWSVVNLVFDHLVANGLHPVLGETGDPSRPATDLLRALGVEPGPERPAHTQTDVSQQLAELRGAMLGDRPRQDARDDLGGGEAPDDATQNPATQNPKRSLRTIDKGR